MVINQVKNANCTKNALAVLVSTDKHLDHVINVTNAAFSKGIQVNLFFTAKGVLLTVDPRFRELAGKATIRICNISFRDNGLCGREGEIPGVSRTDFSTQAANAQMLNQSDRYLVF